MHPLELAADLIAKYAPLCSDRETALIAVARMLDYADADERECKRCGETFLLTEPQRECFASRGLHEPVHCLKCRLEKEQAKAARWGSTWAPSLLAISPRGSIIR